MRYGYLKAKSGRAEKFWPGKARNFIYTSWLMARTRSINSQRDLKTKHLLQFKRIVKQFSKIMSSKIDGNCNFISENSFVISHYQTTR